MSRPRRSQPLARPADPAWRWNTSACCWALPVVTWLDLVVRLEHEGDSWAVVVIDADTDNERMRVALALGDFAAHKALGRMLWRRLQRVPIELVGLIQ